MSANPPNRKRRGNDKAGIVQRCPFHNSITGRALLEALLVNPTAQQRLAEGQEIAESEACWRGVGSIRQSPAAQANPAPSTAAVATDTRAHTRVADNTPTRPAPTNNIATSPIPGPLAAERLESTPPTPPQQQGLRNGADGACAPSLLAVA
jgi:hypothetical protein